MTVDMEVRKSPPAPTDAGAPGTPLAQKADREGLVMIDSKLGVRCESCHGPAIDYRKKNIFIDRDLAISRGLVPPVAHPVPEGYDPMSGGEAG